jgi:hypothetical protein
LSRWFNTSEIGLLSSHFTTLFKIRKAQLKLELVKFLQQLAAVELRIDVGELTFRQFRSASAILR